jgi:hypothetical protein
MCVTRDIVFAYKDIMFAASDLTALAPHLGDMQTTLTTLVPNPGNV